MTHNLTVIGRVRSENEKIGRAATTLAAQQSCPRSCAFKDGGGCYAEGGTVGKLTVQMNRVADEQDATPADIARSEAALIDSMVVPERGWPMRLHTAGDCATGEAALIVSRAAERWMARGGGPVWTYTHGFRDVSRSVWGRVSVLASCETLKDVALARHRGYAPSIVVPEFPSRKRFSVSEGGDTAEVVPCPAQTRDDVTCSSCRLCFDDGRLRRLGIVIGFAVHGDNFVKRQARRALADPADPGRRLTSRQLIPPLLVENPGWSQREVADELGINLSSAKQMIGKLRREGVIA